MARTYRQRFLAAMTQNERDLERLFQGLADSARGTLTAAAGPDGSIPATGEAQVRRTVQGAVTRLYLLQESGGQLAPFTVVRGEVIPLSPYMRVLWRHITSVTRLAVERHARDIQKRLAREPAVLARMRRARGNPFEAARRVSQQTGAVWRPNPFAAYDPAHTWLDQRGYRLSDRIWDTSVRTRARIDALIEEGIREGRSAMAIAGDLEDFLLPGRKLLRTDRPYGQDASADAMRLARTEITRAHAQADFMAANMNPFVETFDWVLSGSHPKPDVCDDLAAGGPYLKGGDVRIPPAHPHCLCSMRWNTGEKAGTVIADLRAEVRKQRSLLLDLVGPLLLEQFVRMLLRQLEVFAPIEPVPFP